MTVPVAPVLLHSPLLSAIGVPHAFTTRQGGVSGGVFASLNFGNPMDLPAEARDPVENIAANFRRVLAAVGAPDRAVTQVYQVHGAEARTFRRGGPSRERTPEGERDFKADALVTDDVARMVAVRIADCAPVLLASADGRTVAAVHAGWRGVVAGVAAGALAAMRSQHAGEIVAAIGPCIGPEHFEVGPEVAEQFAAAGLADAVHPGRPGKHHADLKAALRQQLRAAGIERIDTLPGCTHAEPERFYSHRREGGKTGRMVALIGPTRATGCRSGQPVPPAE